VTEEQHYSISIRSGERPIVSCEHFFARHSGITFLFGESGIGKSLLCKALYGLLDPEELDVTVNGRPYRDHLEAALTKEIFHNSFFVFQEPSSHLNPLKRIGEQLREGSLGKAASCDPILQRLWQNAREDSIRNILNLYPKPYRPSGGEKQRILLAMSFEKIDLFLYSRETNQPTFFVFDEPTGSLDNHYRNLFIRFLFEKYDRSPFTVMFITHDYSIISEIYAHYQHLLPAIHFKELSRKNETAVELHDFSAREYLAWLEAAAPPKYGTAENRGEVLRVEPEFSIFGRNHRICKDPARTHEAPLVLRQGELVYIKAESGVGKTSLAKIIMGLYPAQRFAMSLSGIAITHRTSHSVWPRRIWGKTAGMVFQHADEALDMEANIKETFQGLPRSAGLDTRDILTILSPLFDESRLTEDFLKRKVAFLSGGQKQRLNLLRTLTLATDLIILDEPLNGLDFKGVTRVLGLLEEIRKSGSALLLISHNEEIFDSLVDEDHRFYLA
jgi:peptide/nickel transport system ATP-binding protein